MTAVRFAAAGRELMCLLAVYFRAIEGVPLLVGANREEAYARGGTPPQLLTGTCAAVGGTDPTAGGTWLGVNQYGVLAAVTNRPKSRVPDRPRSRGLLLRELLERPNVSGAVDWAARELGSNRYAGCNVVCADTNNLIVIHAGDWLRIRPMPPGLHALTARDVDDAHDPRLAHTLGWLGRSNITDADAGIRALKELCGQKGNGGPQICIRREMGGTVSSSIILLRQPLSESIYLHAQGPPDCTPYEDYSELMRKL
jgi:hypothetical protein